MARIFSLAIRAAVALETVTIVASGQVGAVALDAGVGEAFVDVDLTVGAIEACGCAVALEAVEVVAAPSAVARVRVALVDLVLAVLAGVAGRADALVIL